MFSLVASGLLPNCIFLSMARLDGWSAAVVQAFVSKHIRETSMKMQLDFIFSKILKIITRQHLEVFVTPLSTGCISSPVFHHAGVDWKMRKRMLHLERGKYRTAFLSTTKVLLETGNELNRRYIKTQLENGQHWFKVLSQSSYCIKRTILTFQSKLVFFYTYAFMHNLIVFYRRLTNRPSSSILV